MKLSIKIFFPILATSILLLFWNNLTSKKAKTTLQENIKFSKKHPKFNTYWYQGKAEITSYKLTQSRYGELHTGTAVNIFVTEDFLPNKQVKADSRNNSTVPILKLNSTKKFVTGIYPYSLMTSTFSPVSNNKKALKISFSSQEWCGNTFVQLNNKTQFEIDFHSYFESNADRKLSLKKNILENELWNLLRINPKNLPIGNVKIIPSFDFLALHHQKIKAYKAKTSLKEVGNFIIYSINYPELKRIINIKATKEFPFIIESWEETTTERGEKSTTKAEKINTILSAYWSKNGVADVDERKQLGLN
jgi:hypothetical protein